jgi:hypothetical protein
MSNLPRSLKASNERKMRVFMASDASDWNVGKGSLEVILGEGEIWHEQVMRNVLAAVEDLLRDPEGERRDAGRYRCRPCRVAVLGLLFLPPGGELILAISHDDDDGLLASGRNEGAQRRIRRGLGGPRRQFRGAKAGQSRPPFALSSDPR